MKPEDQLRSETIQPVAAATETVREQDKIQLVLAYLFPLIPFLTVKDSEFVKWHSKQGLAMVLGHIALAIVGSVLAFTCIVPILTLLASIGILVLEIMGIVKSLKGERWRAPVFGDLADKF